MSTNFICTTSFGISPAIDKIATYRPKLSLNSKIIPSLRLRHPSSYKSFAAPTAMTSEETQSKDRDSEKVLTISHQRIIIKNDQGENLVGLLQNAGSNKLVILCHGFRSSKRSKTLTSIADALTNEGTSVFLFDFSGNGESEGLFQYGNYWKEVDDLRAVTLHFSTLNYEVDAICGHSKGGNVVLLYASKYQDVSTVINISGRFNLEGGIEDRLGKDYMEKMNKDGFIDVTNNMGEIMYRVTKESLEDRLNTDMHGASLSIDKNCRVLTVHGSEDDIVPPDDALQFSKLINNHKLQIIEGADHGYSAHQSQLAKFVIDFLDPDRVGSSDN